PVRFSVAGRLAKSCQNPLSLPGFRHDRGNNASVPSDRATDPRDGGDSCGPILLRPGDIAMRLFAALLSLVLLAVAPAVPAGAEDAPPPVKGLFLLTDYPAVTVRPGTTTTINLRLRNYAVDP